MIADSLPGPAARLLDERSPPSERNVERESRSGRRWWIYGAIVLALGAAATATVGRWMVYRMQHVVSHDATVRGVISQIGARFDGRVAEFHVAPSERVRKGDLLATLDDGHLMAAVARWQEESKCAQKAISVEQARLEHDREILEFERRQAEAEVDTLRETRAAHQSSVDRWRKEQARLDAVKVPPLVAAEESLVRRWTQHKARLEAIENRGVVSKYELELAASELSSATALLRNAQDRHQSERHLVAAELEESQALVRQTTSQIRAAEHHLEHVKSRIAALGVSQLQIALLEQQAVLAKTQLAAAEVELEAARLRAPEDGWIVGRNVETGASVKVGQPIVTLWQAGPVWLEAWVDETRLRDIHVGAEVDVQLSAYPDTVFLGRVKALGVVAQPTTERAPKGAALSAYGDATQVAVQIDLPDADPRVMPGLSAVVGIREEGRLAEPATLPEAVAGTAARLVEGRDAE
jgi:multidrug resistance efflux pump